MRVLPFLSLLFLFSCQTGEKKKKAHNYHAIGVSLLKKCDGKAALLQLRRAARLQPKEALIRYTLGSTYFLMKEYKLALKEFETALERNPNFTEARVNLALSLIESGELERALKELKKAEQDLTYTETSRIISYKAYGYFKQKKYKKAKAEFKKIYKHAKPNLCFNHLHLGQSEFYLKNYKEAEEILKKATVYCQQESLNKTHCRQEPHSFEEHYFLGQVYALQKKFQKARYHLKIFIKRANPSHPLLIKAKEQIKNGF